MAVPLLCRLNVERAGVELSPLPWVTEHRRKTARILTGIWLPPAWCSRRWCSRRQAVTARTFCPHWFGILHKGISWVPTSRLPCKSAALNPLQLFLMGSINLYTMISYYKSSSSESKINGVYNREHSQRSRIVPWHLFLETHFKCKEQVKNFSLTLITTLCQYECSQYISVSESKHCWKAPQLHWARLPRGLPGEARTDRQTRQQMQICP